MNAQQMLVQLSMGMSTDMKTDAGERQNVVKGKDEAFGSVMSKQFTGQGTDVKQESSKADISNVNPVQVSDCARKEQLQSAGEITETEDMTLDQLTVEDLPEEVLETVVGWLVQMRDQIAAELDITPEELEQVLGQMGLQLADLQQQANVQQLVLTVSGEEDLSVLLTNDTLASQVQCVMEIADTAVQQICQETELPDEMISELLAKVEEQSDMQNQDLQFSSVLSGQEDFEQENFGQEEQQIAKQNTVGEQVTVSDQYAEVPSSVTDDAEQNVTTIQPQDTETFSNPDIQVQLEKMQTGSTENTTAEIVTEELQSQLESTTTDAVVTPQSEETVEADQAISEAIVPKENEATSEVSQEEPQMLQMPVSEAGQEQSPKDVVTTVTESVSAQQTVAEQKEEWQTTAENSSDAETVQTMEDLVEEIQPKSEEDATEQKGYSEEQPKDLFQQVVNHLVDAKVEATMSVEEKTQIAHQMQEIVEQVVEQMKITLTDDTSEISMQLHPESLGKVNLSVVTKDGHVTAQFVAENELARQALEGQIQRLRDSLGDQGLKVDEVEVSVSDFSFTQGNQTNAEEQKEQQRSSLAKQLHRNLNLADITDDSDMTEEERLAASIMRDAGNQIDFTA